jgi:hypothetical protein
MQRWHAAALLLRVRIGTAALVSRAPIKKYDPRIKGSQKFFIPVRISQFQKKTPVPHLTRLAFHGFHKIGAGEYKEKTTPRDSNAD